MCKHVLYLVWVDMQLTSLWKKRATEVIVSVVPYQTRGHSLIIHHSELRSLRPHQRLTGEVYFVYYSVKAVLPMRNQL